MELTVQQYMPLVSQNDLPTCYLRCWFRLTSIRDEIYVLGVVRVYHL